MDSFLQLLDFVIEACAEIKEMSTVPSQRRDQPTLERPLWLPLEVKGTAEVGVKLPTCVADALLVRSGEDTARQYNSQPERGSKCLFVLHKKRNTMSSTHRSSQVD